MLSKLFNLILLFMTLLVVLVESSFMLYTDAMYDAIENSSTYNIISIANVVYDCLVLLLTITVIGQIWRYSRKNNRHGTTVQVSKCTNIIILSMLIVKLLFISALFIYVLTRPCILGITEIDGTFIACNTVYSVISIMLLYYIIMVVIAIKAIMNITKNNVRYVLLNTELQERNKNPPALF